VAAARHVGDDGGRALAAASSSAREDALALVPAGRNVGMPPHLRHPDMAEPLGIALGARLNCSP
jgi:hypothetical protein